MAIRPNLSIADQGGIRAKLEAERELHRGRGWAAFDELCRLHTASPRQLPKTTIGYLMNVSSKTIENWMRLRDASQREEQ